MKNHFWSNLCKGGILTCSLLLGAPVSAQKAMEKGYETISEEQGKNYVEFLADDLLEGRDAGMRGGQLAGKYIASLLRDWQIPPYFSAGYAQSFDVAMLTKPQHGRWEVHPDSIAKINTTTAYRLRHLNNIIAAIPGKKLDEFIVIGAHYDHEGMEADILPDGIYNGADDNASGVSAVLQIAKAFRQSGELPERTVIFAFWDGEEKGLLGSRYFTAHWPHPEQIKGYMNFDMIGRGPVHKPDHLTYFYTASHPAFGDWLQADMKKYHFAFDPNYRPWENPVGGSDNGCFAKIGVPIVWYHTEGHPDYTRPTDHADKIDYKKMTDITRAAFLCAWRMANQKKF